MRANFRRIQFDNADTVTVAQNDIHLTNIQDVALLVDPGDDCENCDRGGDTNDTVIETEP